MKKRIYRYVRYYLEIPRRIAEPSLGIRLEARRFAEYIIIGPAGRSDFVSTVENLARQNRRFPPGDKHVCLNNPSNTADNREKT
jgi:hypothetical protein